MAETIRIETDFIKLDSFLKFAALVGSGGEAKTVIADGLVSVNGETCTMRGKKIYPGDRVDFQGFTLEVTKA
jgi:ribosome-associated protein